MGFVNFLAYVKHLGEKALVFFPSKTDLITISSKDGEATEELLSERLETINNKIEKQNLLKNVAQYTKENPLFSEPIEGITEFQTTVSLEAGKYYSFSFEYEGTTYFINNGKLFAQGEVGLFNENGFIDFINSGKMFFENFYFKCDTTGTYTFFWNVFEDSNIKVYNLKIVEGYSSEMVRTIEEIKKLDKDGDASTVTVTFEEATEKVNIQSGDSLATAFAKLAKFCSDLEALETNKDRITKGEYRLRIDGSTIIGERKMTETAWATGYSSLGTDSKRFSSVHAGSFHEGGKNISTIYAPINSPTFTGTPKAPTPVATSNDTSLATTAFVKREIGNIIGDAPETLDTLKEIADAIEEHKDVTDALNAAIGNKVSKSGDTMTGTLTAPLFSGPVEARKGGMSVYLSPSGILSDSIQNFCVWNPSSGNNIEIAPMDKSEVKTTLELHNVDNIHDKDKYVKGVIDQSGTKGQKITITYAQDAGITSSNWFPAYDATDPANIKIRPISAANLANKLGVPSYTLLNISSDSSTNFDVTGVKVLKFSGIPLCYFQGFLRATVTKELADAAILFNFENKEFDNYVLENNEFHQVGFINFGTGTRGRLMLQKNNSGYRIRAYSDDGNGITTVANSKLFIKGSFLLL